MPIFLFQHCNLDFGSYTKDLSAITDDLSSIFILDNSPGAYRSYPGKEDSAGLILGLRPANERWRYFVTPSLIGCAQA